MFYFLISLIIVLAYMTGSVPNAVWIGRMLYKIDVREHGSGNAGATNVIRVLGYKAGIPVLLLDVFKGWVAVQWIWLLPEGMVSAGMTEYLRIALAFAAVLGHVFPVFAGFRGGKGVGTMAGAAIALYPVALLIVLFVFIIVLALTRYVSLSSITAGVLFPFIVWFVTGERHTGLVLLAVVVALFLPFTHRKNIKRLITGKENKFDFSRKKKADRGDIKGETNLEN